MSINVTGTSYNRATGQVSVQGTRDNSGITVHVVIAGDDAEATYPTNTSFKREKVVAGNPKSVTIKAYVPGAEGKAIELTLTDDT